MTSFTNPRLRQIGSQDWPEGYSTYPEVAAATLGFMSLSRLILAAAAPPIGSIFYNISPDWVFIYIAVLFAVSTIILIITPIPKPLRS